MKRKEKKVVKLKTGIIVTKIKNWENTANINKRDIWESTIRLDVTSQYNEYSPYNKPLK